MIEPVASSLTLLAITASSSLGIALNEATGKLMGSGSLGVNPSTGKLAGTYADAAATTAAISGGASLLYAGITIHHWVKTKPKEKDMQAFLSILLLTALLGVASAVMLIFLTERYGAMIDSSIVVDPKNPTSAQNFSLRGSFGLAHLTIHCVTIATTLTSFIMLMVLRFPPQKGSKHTAHRRAKEEDD